jgi:hypothetical protein
LRALFTVHKFFTLFLFNSTDVKQCGLAGKEVCFKEMLKQLSGNCCNKCTLPFFLPAPRENRFFSTMSNGFMKKSMPALTLTS